MISTPDLLQVLESDFYNQSTSAKESSLNLLRSFEEKSVVESFSAREISHLIEACASAPEVSVGYQSHIVGAIVMWSSPWSHVERELLNHKGGGMALLNELQGIIDHTIPSNRNSIIYPKRVKISKEFRPFAFSQYSSTEENLQKANFVLQQDKLTDDQAYLMIVSCFALCRLPKQRRKRLAALIKTAPRYASSESHTELEQMSIEQIAG